MYIVKVEIAKCPFQGCPLGEPALYFFMRGENTIAILGTLRKFYVHVAVHFIMAI